MKSTIFKPYLRLITLSLLLASMIAFPRTAWGLSGTPDSTKFGYGARLDAYGAEVALALKAADSIGMDWIGVDLDWTRVWPDRGTDPQLEALDFVMRKTSTYELATLISITNPPRWAITAKGPDQVATTQLVLLLAERYRQNLLSIELFPGANTVQGWGAEPDPLAYKTLLKSCWKALQSSQSPVLLVAGGLKPIVANRSAGDMDDLAFLSGLYRSGAEGFMPVVSLRLPAIPADLLADPKSGSAGVLRHYEAIRKIMKKYGHNSGLIWITGYTCPVHEVQLPEDQAEWINQSYQQMRSQLYIGAAFLDGLNPPDKNSTSDRLYLIHKDGAQIRLHPALAAIGKLITLDRTGQFVPTPLSGKISSSGAKQWITSP
jgi:hypothetical protein